MTGTPKRTNARTVSTGRPSTPSTLTNERRPFRERRAPARDRLPVDVVAPVCEANTRILPGQPRIFEDDLADDREVAGEEARIVEERLVAGRHEDGQLDPPSNREHERERGILAEELPVGAQLPRASRPVEQPSEVPRSGHTTRRVRRRVARLRQEGGKWREDEVGVDDADEVALVDVLQPP